MSNRRSSFAVVARAMIALAFALAIWPKMLGKNRVNDVLMQIELRSSQSNTLTLMANKDRRVRSIDGAGGFQNVRFGLPRENIKELKLLLWDKPARITLGRIVFRNFSKQRAWSTGQVRQLISRDNGIQEWRDTPAGPEFSTSGGEPYLVFSEKLLPLIASLQSDRLLPLMLTAVISLLFFLLLLWSDPLRPFRTLYRRPVSPISIVFFLILFLPLGDSLFHFSERWRLSENRALAPAPVFRFDAFWGFPEIYERYHADRFGMRSIMVRLYNRLRLKGFRMSPNPAVMFGKSGWLYLAQEGDARNVIDYHRGLYPFTPAELEHWKDVLCSRRDWLKSRGIQYLVVWVPDKTSIYPEFLPSSVRRVRPVTRLDQLLEYTRSRVDLPMLDLRPFLLEAKKETIVFLRTDSHWNDYGAYIGYAAMMERLRAYFPDLAPIPRSDLVIRKETILGGDLAWMLAMSESMKERVEIVSFPKWQRSRDVKQPDPPNPWIIWGVTEVADPRLPRAVMFRDSFAHRLMGYTSENFSHIFYMWDRAMNFDTNLVLREKPDVVIEEITERYLLGFTPENPARLREEVKLPQKTP